MKQYYPSIHEKDIDELISIAHSNTDEWQAEAIEQARQELIKRNITEAEQQSKLQIWKKELDLIDFRVQKQREKNSKSSYNIIEMILIFIFSLFILLGKLQFISGMSLSELKQENFNRKYKQRMILLITGLIFWIVLIQMARSNTLQ